MGHTLFGLWESISKKESIRIAVDGSSYEYDDETLRSLSTLSLFSQFEVFYVSSHETRTRHGGLRILIPRISSGGAKDNYEIDLEELGRQFLFRSGFSSTKAKEKYPPELLGAIAFGDLVITKRDLESKSDKDLIWDSFHSGRGFIGSFSECLSALRAWVYRKGILNFSPRHRLVISRGMATSNALPRLVPNSKRAWRAAVVSQAKNLLLKEGTVKDYIGSVVSRVNHLLTTRDLLEILKLDSLDKLRVSDKDYSHLANYYFGYFLMLLTGVVDSTETLSYWCICDRQEKPDGVSFRRPKKVDKQQRVFLEKMLAFNKGLAEYVGSEESQVLLKLIYALRNLTAHEILPSNLTSQGNFLGLSGDLLVFKGKVMENMRNYADVLNLSKDQLIGLGAELKAKGGISDRQEIWVEPILFVRYMLVETLKFIENVLGYLQIEKIILTSTEEIEKFDHLGKLSRPKPSPEIFERVNEAMAYIEASVP